MWPKSIHGGYNCDVSIEPLKSETYTKGVTIRRDEYFFLNIKIVIISSLNYRLHSELREVEKSLGV